MSVESENSDSWGSLLIDGIMAKMVKVSGLRIVKSKDCDGEQAHMQKDVRHVPKKMIAKKDKKDLQPKKYTGKSNRSNGPQWYTGRSKYSDIAPEKDVEGFFDKRLANHEAKKEKKDEKVPIFAPKIMKIHKKSDEISNNLYCNPIVKENYEKLDVENEQDSEHFIENNMI